jgi:hypothetical protein
MNHRSVLSLARALALAHQCGAHASVIKRAEITHLFTILHTRAAQKGLLQASSSEFCIINLSHIQLMQWHSNIGTPCLAA